MLCGRLTVRQDHDLEASSRASRGRWLYQRELALCRAVARNCARNGPLLLASIQAQSARYKIDEDQKCQERMSLTGCGNS
jgi:hypothetical protein